jgi:hypothetical protein
MGLRSTHGDESERLGPIDSKWVIRDFQGSVIAIFTTITVCLYSRIFALLPSP